MLSLHCKRKQSRWYSIGTIFRNNKTITAFTEFELFTAVTQTNQRFQGCSNLTKIKLPPLTKLENLVFDGCSKLGTIIIPVAVTAIGNWCFRGCGELKTITSLPTTPPTWGTDSFSSVTPDVVYVPSMSVSTYKTASGWSDFASVIQAIPE